MATYERVVYDKVTKFISDYLKHDPNSVLSEKPVVIEHFASFGGGGIGWQSNQIKLLNYLLDNFDNTNSFVVKSSGYISNTKGCKIGVDCDKAGYYTNIFTFSYEEVKQGIEYLVDALENNRFSYGNYSGNSKNDVLYRVKELKVFTN